MRVPTHVLIVSPSWVGDATMATPAFRAIAAAWPAARRTLLCRPGIDAVLDGLGLFDEVIVDRIAGVLGPLRTGQRLRGRGIDCAILFPNSMRTGLAVRLAGIPQRIGYARDGRGLLLTTRLRPPSSARPTSTLDSYCDLLEGACGLRVSDRRPILACTDDERRGADRALDGVVGPYAVLVPGGNNPAKRWPTECFARVAAHLHDAHGCAIVLSGSPGERDVLDRIQAESRVTLTNLAQRSMPLGALKGIISRARIVISNDTGPRHIAAAFGIPTVALFGPTDHRWTRLPGVPERLVIAEPFLPEEIIADQRPAVCRIDRISVGDVTSAIDALLASRVP